MQKGRTQSVRIISFPPKDKQTQVGIIKYEQLNRGRDFLSAT